MTTTETPNDWELIARREGGAVSALAFSPTFSLDRTAFAATLAGVFRSTDAGQSWRNVSQGLASPFVDSLIVSPDFETDRSIFAGGREGWVSRSTDGGQSWEPLPAWTDRPPAVTGLAISRTYRQDGIVFASAEDGHVYRTVNRGRSWSDSSRGLAGAPVLALATAPRGMVEYSLFALTPEGLFRSDDDGDTWTMATLLPSVGQAVRPTVSFEMDQTIFVGTEDAGVFRSTDAGQSWTQINAGLTDLCVNALALSPSYLLDQIVFAGTADGVYRSDDRGETWVKRASDQASLCIAVAPPPIVTPTMTMESFDDDFMALQRIVLVGTVDDGVIRSPNAGIDWQSASAGLSARMLIALAISPDYGADKLMLAGSLEDGVLRSDDGGQTWHASAEGLPSPQISGLTIAPAVARNGLVATATAAGVAVSLDRGRGWRPVGGPSPTQAIAIGPADAGSPILAAGPDGSLHLLSTTVAGMTWQPLPAPCIGSEVTALAFSPAYAADHTIFAAASRPGATPREGQAAVWRSVDGGRTWATTMEERGATRWLSLAIPPTYPDDGAFFIGLANRVLRPMRRAPGDRLSGRLLWIGEQPGKRHTSIVALAASPGFAQDQTLFAAASTGVYVSYDAGLSWRALGASLHNQPIVALAVSPAYSQDRQLFVASLGGAIWRLRNQPNR